MSAATPAPAFDFMVFGAALAGSTAAGYLALGVDPVDLVTSVSGSLGAAVGYSAGAYLEGSMPSDYSYFYPMAGAIVVPGLAAGRWDAPVLILGAGAIAGCYAYKMYKKE